jgi:hypothetical protein
MITFFYVAASLVVLWLILHASTREYQTKDQKKIDKIFRKDFKPLVKIVEQEIKYYKKTGQNSKKWLTAMSRLESHEKKYGKANVNKYIPKKYRKLKFPWANKNMQKALQKSSEQNNVGIEDQFTFDSYNLPNQFTFDSYNLPENFILADDVAKDKSVKYSKSSSNYILRNGVYYAKMIAGYKTTDGKEVYEKVYDQELVEKADYN